MTIHQRSGALAATVALGVLASGCAGSTITTASADIATEAVLPESIDPAALCGGIDKEAVADLIGGEPTRESSWSPDDPTTSGGTRGNHGCRFERLPRRSSAPHGPAVTFSMAVGPQRSSGLERALYESDAFEEAACTVSEVQGVPADMGFAASCNVPRKRGTYVRARHEVGLVLGDQVVSCSVDALPAWLLPDDVGTTTKQCLGILEKAGG